MGAVFHLYGTFLLFGFSVVSTCPDGDCRELAFPEFFFFADKRLVNHFIKTLQVNDFDMCQLRCYQNPNCVSINFNFNQESQGNHNCELNNATHKSHGDELDAYTGYAYHGTLNACDKPRCKNGGTCQSGFTDKGYRCMCPLGFTLAHCGQDIDECLAGKHNCSHIAVCNNTIGSYDCTCKEGYVGDGRNCSDIDECSTAKHNCSHDAVCNNTIGSYICTCKKGYVGDGGNCSDIDECSTGEHNCSHVAVCKNTIGSYNCICQEGYVGDGRSCSGYSGIVFTSQYKGQSILGTVGSSVTFSWSFSGGVSGIIWGKANPNNRLFVKTPLVYLSPTGSVSIIAPASYSQRVSGILVGNAFSGQAIFNISGFETKDAGNYACVLYKGQKTKRDHVILSVN